MSFTLYPPRSPVGRRFHARAIPAIVALALVVTAVGPLSLGPTAAPGAVAQAAPGEAGRDEADVIVVLRPKADPEAVARAAGVRPRALFQHVFKGFAGRVPAQAIGGLRRNPNVELVSLDQPVEIVATTLPTGVDRVEADASASAGIGGDGGRVDADVAVLDTGIANHPDLDVAGGERCIGDGGYGDGDGHGTHVAGTVGALDDGQGVVGVAPGARLWAVKVLGDDGSGSWSSVICGLDWVYANRATIDVVNMSLGGAGDDGSCAADPLHRAICAVVDGGVPVVVAAGNDGANAAGQVPATFEEVITVSAFTDFDGAAGGNSEATCTSGGRDDTFAGFSNFGADVDIAAPGVCIRSTLAGGGTGLMSGTSMASPHVAGALALFAADNPGASPAEGRAWLLGDASRTQGSADGFGGDPDGSSERVLHLGSGGEAAVAAPATGDPTVSELGVKGDTQSGNSNSAHLAADGDPATAWVTGTSNPPRTAFARFDLGAVRSVAEIRWTFKRVGFADRFRIQVSDDGQEWTTLATRRNAPEAGAWESLATAADGRYVRFLFTNPNVDPKLGYLSEVEIRGS